MRKIVLLLFLALAMVAAHAQRPACGSGNINASYNDNVNYIQYLCTTAGWKANAGIGAPTVGYGPACYGNQYVDVQADQAYVCGVSGWVSSGGGGGGPFLLPVYGTLVNQSSFTSLTGYSGVNTTPTTSGGALQFSGGSLSPLNQSLDWVGTNSYVTVLPLFSINETETVGAKTSTSYGVGEGLHSVEASGTLEGFNAYVDLSTGGTAGTLIIQSYYNTTITNVAASSSALTITAGDSVQTTCSFIYWTLNCAAQDLTTNSAPVTATYTWSFVYPQTVYVPNAARFALWNLGGSQTVTAFSVTSSAPMGADFAEVGDSKTTGYYQGTAATTWASQLQQNVRSVTLAGSGDRTTDVTANLPEIFALAPKNIILNIGRNDICGDGISLPAVETRYSTLVTAIEAGLPSVKLWHLIGLTETTSCNATLVSFYSWISSTYSATNQIINVPMSSYPSSYILAGDGVHPSPAGATLIYNTVLAALQSNAVPTITQSLDGGALTPPVGIGTATPQAYLDIGTGGGARIQGFSLPASGTGLELGYYATGPYGYIYAYNRTSSVYEDLSIGVGGSIAQLYLKANGAVGVGTSSPTAKLDVSGVIRTTASTTIPSSGSGVETYFTGGNGFIESYNRTSSVYTPMDIEGLTLGFNITSGGSVTFGNGNVSIGSGSTHTQTIQINGVLQSTGTGWGITYTGVYSSGGNAGVSKTCTTYPTVVGGIVTGC